MSSRQIFHIIFRRIVLEAAQIWQDLFHIIFQRIVLEAAQIWREPQQKNRHNHTTVPAQIWWELAPHHFPADCFGGSSDVAETTKNKLTTVLYTKYVNKKLTQQHNWKKGSSSPRKASVFVSPSVILSVRVKRGI
jgi:hypothetical protein